MIVCEEINKMRKIIFSFLLLGLMSAACSQVELKRETPSSPKESYEQLPK